MLREQVVTESYILITTVGSITEFGIPCGLFNVFLQIPRTYVLGEQTITFGPVAMVGGTSESKDEYA